MLQRHTYLHWQCYSLIRYLLVPKKVAVKKPKVGNKNQKSSENIRLEVRFNTETVWLNRQQMALLFDRDVKTIGKHIHRLLHRLRLVLLYLKLELHLI